jgi:apolipoprotein D and lipocalin family protein
MAKYNGSGWHKQSSRHSDAKKYGKANPSTIDLKRYSGTWKQTSVKNEPIFQKGCEKVTATYTPIKKGKIKVTNRCYKKGKKVGKITGTARSISKSNKKLKVSFFPPFEGNYKITKINPNYTKARVKSGKTTWELQKVK